MTIDKAIAILARWREEESVDNEVELHEAEALGIEALKVIKEFRTGCYKTINSPLPGETK